MNTFAAWAARHHISAAAIAELEGLLGVAPDLDLPAGFPHSETAVQNGTRLAAARRGDMILWRNNVGCLPDDRGIPVRFGLANDSERMNKVLKSSDLIGIWTRTVTPEMVGTKLGQFVALEAKRENWHYAGTGREPAQLNFINLVHARGGHARFINHAEQLS